MGISDTEIQPTPIDATKNTKLAEKQVQVSAPESQLNIVKQAELVALAAEKKQQDKNEAAKIEDTLQQIDDSSDNTAIDSLFHPTNPIPDAIQVHQFDINQQNTTNQDPQPTTSRRGFIHTLSGWGIALTEGVQKLLKKDSPNTTASASADSSSPQTVEKPSITSEINMVIQRMESVIVVNNEDHQFISHMVDERMRNGLTAPSLEEMRHLVRRFREISKIAFADRIKDTTKLTALTLPSTLLEDEYVAAYVLTSSMDTMKSQGVTDIFIDVNGASLTHIENLAAGVSDKTDLKTLNAIVVQDERALVYKQLMWASQRVSITIHSTGHNRRLPHENTPYQDTPEDHNRIRTDRYREVIQSNPNAKVVALWEKEGQGAVNELLGQGVETVQIAIPEDRDISKKTPTLSLAA